MFVVRYGPALLDARCFCLSAIVRGFVALSVFMVCCCYCLLRFDDARCLCLRLLNIVVVCRTLCVVGCVLLGLCCSLRSARCVFFGVHCWLPVVCCVVFAVCCLLCFAL